jgi:hypothetical protein
VLHSHGPPGRGRISNPADQGSHGRFPSSLRRARRAARLTVTEPFFGATARGMANYRGYTEIAVLIGG